VLLAGVVALGGTLLAISIRRYPQWLGIEPGSSQQEMAWLSIAVVTFAALMVLTLYFLLMRRLALSLYRQQGGDDVPAAPPPAGAMPEARGAGRLAGLQRHARELYGRFWRRRLCLLLVVGEPDQIEAVAPGLAAEGWLMGDGAILLWGGSTQTAVDEALLCEWRPLCRWWSPAGVIWAVTPDQILDNAGMRIGTGHLQTLARHLGWRLPLHLWQVRDCAWSQADRPTQAVGTLLPERLTATQLAQHLGERLPAWRQLGVTQTRQQRHHDFLWRLARDLQVGGIAQLQQVLAPWFKRPLRDLHLRGLWFSLPLSRSDAELAHTLTPQPAWQGVLTAPYRRPQRLGWPAARIAHALLLTVAVVWGAGLLLSFATQRAQILEVQAKLAAAQQPGDPASQWLALHGLVRELDRLHYRTEHGAPWYQRFGLDHSAEVLARLWPGYVQANDRLLRDPLVARLEAQLQALAQLPAGSAERGKRAAAAYEQLKAYLMLARPDKAEPPFLARVLASVDTSHNGLVPGLLQFYSEQLPAHPQWRIEADPALVAQVRQVLLGQLGQRNAEAALYQKVLADAAHHYPAMGLAQLAGDTDPAALFKATGSVAGVFTRQAWEGQIRQAIEAVAQARREEIDWVLSDQQTEVADALTPERLQQRLTERYFRDYSSAWLRFLNGVRWRQAGSLGEVIDQLTLMSDARQSPLIAVLNQVAYQGQAGQRGQALADSLMKSAKKLIKQDREQAFEQAEALLPVGPLDATFGPLLSLLGKAPETARDGDRLSVQAFLTRVTRVRLKLQQISTAADPQDMTQALAQTVFQGKSLDLSDTQAYASLIAASLGAEWGAAGQALFVQPLEQAWQRVLQPSAAGLNSQWRRAVVEHWNSAFVGRYPFAATASDASLPMLGQMIRADTGRIEQFLHSQLSGVLRKEGNRWVADSRHGQGLRLNPAFLAAVNRLSHLADVLFTDGGMGLSFELSGRAVPDVVQTTFTLNGERHQYFNQMERWQRFAWPGRGDHPGARLTWTSVLTSMRLFGDYEGTWGLIRLLEQAEVTPLDDGQSRYQLVITAPDGLGLTWHLRTELGGGPLDLLDLRGFELPGEIFLTAAGKRQGEAS